MGPDRWVPQAWKMWCPFYQRFFKIFIQCLLKERLSTTSCRDPLPLLYCLSNVNVPPAKQWALVNLRGTRLQAPTGFRNPVTLERMSYKKMRERNYSTICEVIWTEKRNLNVSKHLGPTFNYGKQRREDSVQQHEHPVPRINWVRFSGFQQIVSVRCAEDVQGRNVQNKRV